jgi:hypothetical protein
MIVMGEKYPDRHLATPRGRAARAQTGDMAFRVTGPLKALPALCIFEHGQHGRLRARTLAIGPPGPLRLFFGEGMVSFAK